MKYILASQSPRRQELLSQLFDEFEVIPATGEEESDAENPAEYVKELSLNKAKEVEGANTLNFFGQDFLIVAADTVVAFQGEILGKPANEGIARRMLTNLGGKTHQVYTGVTLILKQGSTHVIESFAECTDVTFYPITQEEITNYINTGEPMDKAGAYGIQGIGGRFIKEISGDYNNVVGLPVASIYQYLYTNHKDLLMHR